MTFALRAFETYAIIGGWMIFALLFLAHKSASAQPEKTRDRRSLVGMLFQGVGFAAVWSVRRGPSASFLPFGPIAEIMVGAAAIAILAASLSLTYAAIQTLGKQWSVAARLIQGHQLVTKGPYNLVRHPIYTGMLGMLLATGLGLSRWSAVMLGAAVYIFGTFLRVRVEERLLLGAFGGTYKEYSQRVPAFFPRWPCHREVAERLKNRR